MYQSMVTGKYDGHCKKPEEASLAIIFSTSH